MKKFVKEYNKAPQEMNINNLWYLVKHYGLPVKPEWKRSRKAFFKAVKSVQDELKVQEVLDNWNNDQQFCAIKADIASEIKDAVNRYNEELRQAKANAFIALGEDRKEFDIALSVWQNCKGSITMKAEDYSAMATLWGNIKMYLKGETLKDTSLVEIAKLLTKACGNQIVPVENIEELNEDDLRYYLNDLFLTFIPMIEAEKLTKEQYSIIKIDMDAIEFPNGLDNNGSVGIFHSTRCLDIEDAVKMKEDGDDVLMYEVDTAEDGISRIFLTDGNEVIAMYLGHQNTEKDHEDAERRKELIFRNGVYDMDKQKAYFPVLKSASSDRKANMSFITADEKTCYLPAKRPEYISLGVHIQGWEETFDFWCKATGCPDWETFEKTFFYIKDGKKMVNMSKLLARVAIRSSNSFSANSTKINQELNDELKKIKVKNTSDVERTIVRDYITIDKPGVLKKIKDEERPIVCSDGQMVCSIEVAALLSAMIGANNFTVNDYHKFQMLWEDCGKDTRNVKRGSDLYHLIMKMSNVFQIRHEGKKGIIVMYNLERYEETKDFGLIVPKSAQKFTSGRPWEEFPLEICNWLKRKKDNVNLNTQFISALCFDDPESLKTIAKYWVKYIEESFANPVKTMEFHRLMHRYNDDEKDDAVHSSVMRTNHYMHDDRYILKLREKQYFKFFKDMKSGRILVPGMYTYMVADPGFFIENIFGIKTEHLAEGEFYHNGKNCFAGLFRAPMAHFTEAQKVQLVNHNEYWYMKDVIVFNGYDGVWDRMAGADFDGDMCAVITDDTEHGKIIVDAIRTTDWDVWEPAQNAKDVEFTFENLITHLVKSARKSRVGELANFVFRLMEIHNHLKSLVKQAKDAGTNWVYLKSPSEYTKDEYFGWYTAPTIKHDPNGVAYMEARGFAKFHFKEEFKSLYCYDSPILKLKKDCDINNINPLHVTFEDVYTGWFNTERLLNVAYSIDDLTKIAKILESREIDGAKTGIYAEGAKFAETGDEKDSDYIEDIRTNFTSHCILGRCEILGKFISDEDRLNQYVSVSPYGIMYDYLCEEEAKLKEQLKLSGMSKSHYLISLLTDEEYEILENAVVDGKKLKDYIFDRKDAYNKYINQMNNAFDKINDIAGESEDKNNDKNSKINKHKEEEIAHLKEIAEKYNIPMSVLVVAMYIVTYEKTSSQSKGLSYAWLFAQEIVALISRGNACISVIPIYKKGLTRCYIENEFLHVCYMVNDEEKIEKRNRIDGAIDGVCPLFNCNDKICASVQIATAETQTHDILMAKNDSMANSVDGTFKYENGLYTINASGFRYHLGENATSQNWLDTVNANNGYFDIVFDNKKNLVIAVHGKSISAIPTGVEVPRNLYNRAVRMRNNEVVNGVMVKDIKKTDGFIQDIKCTPVIGVKATPVK